MRKSPWSKAVTLVLAFAMVCTSVLTVPQTAEAASKPKEMTLSAKERTLYVGKSFTLKVKSVKPAKASKAVTFKSSNTKVATVNAKGKVTGKKTGKATITATSTSNKKLKATCKITVRQQVEEIMVTNAARRRVVVPKGKALTLKTVVKPDNAADKGVEYIVRKPQIASVSANGKIRAKKYGSTRITLRSKDKQKKIIITAFVPKVRVKSIKLNAAKKSLDVGRTFRLQPTVTPSKASVKMVTYQSSDPKIAYVSIGGNVRGVKPGKAVITATTLDGKKKAKCTITVNAVKVESVKVNPQVQEAIIGQQFTLNARISPSNATNQAVTWKSSNTEVVSITQAGVATAVGVGEAEVTATAKDGTGKVGKCKVTVLPEGGKLYIRTIKVTPSEKSLKVGESATLDAEVTLIDGTIVTEENKDKYAIRWISDNQQVAVVDSKTGRVTAVGVGKANINAVALDGSNEIGTCAVEVTAADLPTTPEVKLTEEKIKLQEGAVKELTWTVTPAGTPVTWHSNDDSVATVADGKVTAVKAGTAIITASVKGGNTASCEVNVISTKPEITLTEVAVNLQVGGSLSLKWSVNPAGTAVNWKSSDDAVASVANGVITAKAVGDAVITASVEGVEDGNSVTCKVHVVPSQGGSSEIILIQEKLNLETGETATLKWSTKPEGALVTWKSSNDSVATVANGVITAKGKGTATITASLEDGTSVTCTVTVKDPKKQIILQNAKVSLQPGQTWTPQYTTNPPNAEVRWRVENAEIATVNETTGEITAVAAGTTTVMGTIDGGDPVTITVTVNGQQKPFIILAEEELNLSVGDRYQLTYEVSSEDVEVEWTSSDETKATVNGNGQIEAKAEGENVTITGRIVGGAEEDKVTCTVTIRPKQEETAPEISLQEASLKLLEGSEVTLNYKVTPEGAEVTWSGYDKDVVELVHGENGKVTIKAIGVGKTTINAKVEGGNTVTCNVTVVSNNEKPPHITITQTEISLRKGATAVLKWHVDPADTVVNWESNNETVAKIVKAEDGQVTIEAVGEGDATITGSMKDSNGDPTGNTVKCIVHVTEENVEITLEEEKLNLVAGMTWQLHWTTKPEGEKPVWTSDSPSVATVNEEGLITAVTNGNAVITGTIGDVSVKCTVEVTVPKISLSETAITLKLNQTEGFLLSAVVIPEELKEAIANGEAEIIWISGEPKVATVERTEEDQRRAIILPTQLAENEGVDPERDVNITAAIYIKDQKEAAATAFCKVTIINEQNAVVEDDNNFIYKLDESAEGYKIQRGLQSYVVSKEDIAHDMAAVVRKMNEVTWDNNFLKNYWHRFNLDTLKQSKVLSKVFEMSGEPEIKDINATTKEITMRGRTIEVKRVDHANGSNLIITYKNSGRTINIEKIQAAKEGNNVVITAEIVAGGIHKDVKLVVSLDGKNATLYSVVSGKELAVATFAQADGSFEIKISQIYYYELLGMFETEDYLSSVKITNMYYKK